MAKQKKNKRNVVFRRIGGRIVPIAVAAGGGGVALDALRTHRVFTSKRIVIDRKKFAFQPFTGFKLGDKLIAREGLTLKSIGQARVYTEGKEGGFSWLSVKREFRGRGVSKKLTRQGAIELKRQGANFIVNHVVHPGSVLSQYKRDRDTFWMENGPRAKERMLNPITKKQALKKALQWNKEWKSPKKLGKNNGVRAIFRETKIPRTLRRTQKVFRTRGNKIRIALGVGLFLGGSTAAISKRNKK